MYHISKSNILSSIRNFKFIVSLTTFVSAGITNQSGLAQLCNWNETQKLLASDGVDSDYFSYSVSISDDVAVIGADGDDDNGYGSGSAYIYRWDSSTSLWFQEQKLLASDGALNNRFGYSVSVSGDVALVGAIFDDDNGTYSGSAYIYRWDPNTSIWNEEQKLIASDGAEYDEFGNSVSISGNIAVVAAYGDKDYGDFTGSAYIYRWNPRLLVWVEEQKVTASDGAAYDHFGNSVSISGDTIVIGAHEDDDNGEYSGSAYIYRYDSNNSVWIQEQKLLPSDGAASDQFGSTVSVSGDITVIGAFGDDDKGSLSGSAYIYRWKPKGGYWIEEQKITASDGAADDYFGRSVAISGNATVIGAYGDKDNGPFSGSAYIFRYDSNGSSWNQEQKLVASDGAADDWYSYAVSISGDNVLIGALFDDDNGSSSGSAYLFNADCPLLTVSPTPLIAGQDATFTVTDANPNTNTFLAYTLHGTGSLYIPFLNITLDLNQPNQAGNTITSDTNGTAQWILHIPNPAAGRNIWFQACQFELKTNVVATIIQ